MSSSEQHRSVSDNERGSEVTKQTIFMTPSRLKVSAVLLIMYQVLVMKFFPFVSKTKMSHMMSKIGRERSHFLAVFSVQIVFRTLLVFLFERLYRHRSLDVFKAQQNKRWLFLEDPEKYEKLRKETYYNYFTKLLPAVLFGLILTYRSGKKSRIDTKFPSVWEMFYQINCSLLIVDFAFYFVHRFIFHNKNFYHHHKDHHSFVNTTVHASLRMSVIDYFIEIIIPGAIGPRLFDMHMFTFILYMITGNAVGIMSHAGYIFPFKMFNMQFPVNEILGKSNNLEHELHHNTFNTNFSAMSVIPDVVFGTTANKKDIE
ncbi:hypothetical protein YASMINEVIRUS_794 [Yasminevirus sp. GU-2018]|uniref:Fatty acid hydroxylase domain-containing protein n=1 Tax=Yasminevirus sp. GU-2018 TaxID=2420051 RepID=A0A5K0U9R8_9VIRU|nr:hypothetical protein YASMINEVIRUS_794 [Yasminevirus sp. GU-2018]